MKTITDSLIVRLYTWTVRDLENIYNATFRYNHQLQLEDGPSNSFALLLAAQFDVWGSIMRDKFGKKAQTNNNVICVLKRLYASDKESYKIMNRGKMNSRIVKLFRHNLVHNFGKNPESIEFSLNIDTQGNAIEQQDNMRWHINCKKLKEDFLNLLRIELPNLINQ